MTGKILQTLSRVITARPYITLIVIFVVTIALGAGFGLRAELARTSDLTFLPPDDPSTIATRNIEEHFADTTEISIVTLLFRGDALTPEGLAQMSSLVDEMTIDPSVSELLVPMNPVITPSLIIKTVLRADSFESVTQAQIDQVRSIPRVGDVLDSLTGTDEDGTPVAVGTIRLTDTGDERMSDAEFKINELASADEGPLQVSSLSQLVIEHEYRTTTQRGSFQRMALALLVIMVLLVLFTRTFSDTMLTLVGLIVSIIWILGLEGWIGPNGLGLIGPPNPLTAIVPVIIISLSVDYAIQSISHYREHRAAGNSVLNSAREGFQTFAVPLVLAAVTTIVSLLASLFSPIRAIDDFGVVAALGVGMSLVVMLTLIPAGRTIIDRRREARGKLGAVRSISNALPGISEGAEWMAKWVTRWPAPFLVVVGAITIALGFCLARSELRIRHSRHPAQQWDSFTGYEYARNGRGRFDRDRARIGDG